MAAVLSRKCGDIPLPHFVEKELLQFEARRTVRSRSTPTCGRLSPTRALRSAPLKRRFVRETRTNDAQMCPHFGSSSDEMSCACASSDVGSGGELTPSGRAGSSLQ
jgi:hypothetical protein